MIKRINRYTLKPKRVKKLREFLKLRESVPLDNLINKLKILLAEYEMDTKADKGHERGKQCGYRYSVQGIWIYEDRAHITGLGESVETLEPVTTKKMISLLAKYI